MIKNKALIVVDMQKDFMEGGPLGIKGSYDLIPIIERYIHSKLFKTIVFTRDYHPNNHVSFDEWPEHCVRGTEGCRIVDELRNITVPYYIIEKGTNVLFDSYSGFSIDGMNKTWLEQLLRDNEIEEVYIVGVATEYCVKYTAIDSAEVGFKTYVIVNGCGGVNQHINDEAYAYNEMKSYGIELIDELHWVGLSIKDN